MKQISGFWNSYKELLDIPDRQQHCSTTSNWSQWCTLQKHYDRIPCYQERMTEKHPQMSSQCLWTFCDQQKHQWLLDKKSDCFWNRKREAPWFPSLRMSSSQLLELNCWSKVKPSFLKINVSKPNNWNSSLLICKGDVNNIIQDLGYWKACTRCIPLNLTVKHKTKRNAICSKLLVCFEAEGEACLSWVVTADESWVHHSRNKEAIHVTAPSSLYLAEKKFKNPSISRQGHDHCRVGLWRCDSCG
jgi:hypothetical protein